MIQKLSYAPVYVFDQDVAYDFYVNKLGFEVRTDVKMESGFRWLAVAPKGQQGSEMVLLAIQAGPMMDAEAAEKLRELIQGGHLSAGVLETSNCQKDYEELSAKGVKFAGPPQEQFYGIEMIMSDPFGNWYSVTQRTN